MAAPAKRVVVTLLFALLLLTASGVATSTVSAVDQDCLDPQSSGTCDAESVVQIQGVLEALFDVVYTGLKYVSITAAAVGAMLWFSASKNSERGRNGLWIFVGGLFMIAFYFMFTLFLEVVNWVSTN